MLVDSRWNMHSKSMTAKDRFHILILLNCPVSKNLLYTAQYRRVSLAQDETPYLFIPYSY